ncbi:MAG TPA: phage protein Gp37, partial [Steroidobacteraceae bacterium]|nr:phage protein Gp37 [Steroidobacteraceae bacterium]
MSKIAAIEDTLIATIAEMMQQRVRTIEYAPTDWDEDYIKQILKALPGVFVIFNGGQSSREDGCAL